MNQDEILKLANDYKELLLRLTNDKVVTLESFRDEYIRYNASMRSNKTIKTAKCSFNQLIRYTGNQQLKDIDVKTSDSFISEVYSRAPSSALQYYNHLSAAFNKALQWNYIFENPFNKVKKPRIPERDIITIPKNELEIIQSNIKENVINDIVSVAVNTGMRLGELVNLQWKSISLSESIINVENRDSFITKSKKNRIIPINENCFKVLSSRYPIVRKINKPEYVFYRIPGVKINEDYVSKKFKRAVKDSGLNNRYSFQALRRTFASELVYRDCPIHEIQILLGHSDIRLTQKYYAKMNNENLINAVNRLNDNYQKIKGV
ncbi:MAG: tyrosine-type recombinase/integrase [Melioribacteraceae bacterium]|nr:tyrosine-type recombinase/integrase [Melioribacteraceae bacterium]MCF8354500.1 tyrosine-type recombinase/integrase [Melioribacteraceae bacterium]MCF8394269.1 tyrosine-type recombinase/integrase [Melioribacteraceae bacterium]MCF8418169.1 tyrosine-type recombinase/integrase [Melioribacteraceae bacterium]